MSRPVVFRPEAEVVDAWNWYEEQHPGLGDVLRVLVRRFPYGVYYQVRAEAVLILAVAHGRWRPHSSPV